MNLSPSDFLDNLEELSEDGNELAQAWMDEYRELDNDVARIDWVLRRIEYLEDIVVSPAWKKISDLIPPFT